MFYNLGTMSDINQATGRSCVVDKVLALDPRGYRWPSGRVSDSES